ncbi:MAG: tetratricopeptide repeat protein [Bacteroidia bacterium]|nr:tetratricopeptide repeat protein [Bacteroidia bacterium]MDW8014996.1 tetratricopeptide repeat protein [Bacteroidia bacterium]
MDKKEAELRLWMEREATDPFWPHALGVYLMGVGRWREAEAAFQEAIRRSPTHYSSLYQLGVVYEHLGCEAEALSAFREGHRLAMEARDMQLMRDFRAKLSTYLGMDEW